MRPNACVVIRQPGCSLILDLTDGRLPAVAHWGADLGVLSATDAAALVRAGIVPTAPNGVDDPIRLSLLPEHWTGWVGRPGISGSRTGVAWSPKFTTTELMVDGGSVDGGSVEGGAESGVAVVNLDGPCLVTIEAVDEVARLGLTVEVESLVGGLFRARAVLTNGADDPYGLDDLVLAFPVPSRAAELFDLAGRWGKERTPQRRRMVVGTHLREGRKGRTGADAATLLHLGEPGFDFGTGEIWAVHTGWSGNHTHYAERAVDRRAGDRRRGTAAARRTGPGRRARPTPRRGSTPRTAWGWTPWRTGSTATSARGPQHPSAQRPVTLNVWEAVYFDHDLARLTRLAEIAAEIGVERFVLDDGWFGGRRNDRAGLGDWTVSKEVWPDGLHPLVDVVTGLGMQFGLWFEPEMINMDSDTARAHPEWVLATGDRLPVEARSQQVINLAIPECYAYIRDAMFALLAEYDIGYIKWDHNRDLDRRGHPAHWPARGARADAGVLPAAGRDQGRSSRAGDRVLLLRRSPGRPGRAAADRPGLGLGLHRPARATVRCTGGRPSCSRPS